MRPDCMPVECLFFDGEDGERRELKPINEVEIIADNFKSEDMFIPSFKPYEFDCTVDRKTMRELLNIFYGSNNSRRFRGLSVRRGRGNWRKL